MKEENCGGAGASSKGFTCLLSSSGDTLARCYSNNSVAIFNFPLNSIFYLCRKVSPNLATGSESTSVCLMKMTFTYQFTSR